MAFYTGKDGELWIDGSKAAKVRGWAFSSSVATLDSTTLSDTDRTAVSGIRSSTGSCQLFYYRHDDGTEGSASALMRKVLQARTVGAVAGVATAPQNAKLRLKVNDGSLQGLFIEGDCILTSVSMAMGVGEILTADVSFEFNGAPLEVDL